MNILQDMLLVGMPELINRSVSQPLQKERADYRISQKLWTLFVPEFWILLTQPINVQ